MDPEIISSPALMQERVRKLRLERRPIALVPTMGALHEGHLSLVREARQRVGADGVVIVSIYVNPTQFGPNEDFEAYPREFDEDRRKCAGEGVEIIFAPNDRQMYAASDGGSHSVHVVERELSRTMEGSSRPVHFEGVTTIVAKLFNCCLPDLAVFGAKDYQQAAIIRKMVHDLNFPVAIEVAPTWREKDGLAMSSRNKYLTAEERSQAPALYKVLQECSAMVMQANDPQSVTADILLGHAGEVLRAYPLVSLEYLAFFHPDSLEAVSDVRVGHHIAIAARLGRTRLIDNIRIR
jgi:pantoate--beta-alanine ligase